MSFLDSRVARRDDARMVALHEILIRAYSKEIDALAIAGSVGILRADVSIYPKLRHTWWSVLEEAASDGVLRRMVHNVLQDPTVAAKHDDVRAILDMPVGELQASVDTGAVPEGQPHVRGKRPSFGERAPLWPLGRTLKIRFLSGDSALHEKVERAAMQWVEYANIWLDFGDHADAEIRVDFIPDMTGWSYLGTTCLQIPDPKPNVNFGWLKPTTPDHYVQMAVLHEFGHVLGMQHEQGNPGSNIRWNKDAVYRQMGAPPYSWSRETIDRFYFAIWPPGYYPVHKIFDPTSIMMAPIPAEFLQEGEQVDANVQLSPVDKQFAAALYLQRER